MASSARYYHPYQTALSPTGAIEPGSTLEFYVTGSGTPKTTYSDAALSVPSSVGDLTANASGLFGGIFLASGDYKVILKDSDGVQVWSADPVAAALSTAATTSVAGVIEIATVAEALLATSSTLAMTPATTAQAIQQGFSTGTTGGTANAITGTPSITPTALADGMKAVIKATASNTSTTTLNWAGLGNVAVKTAGASGGSACAGGEIVLGNSYCFTYSAADACWYVDNLGGTFAAVNNLTEDTTPDGAADFWMTYDVSAKLPKKIKAQSLGATQTQAEAAASAAVYVTPAVQQNHPGHPKWWARVTVSAGTPTLGTSYNVTSITDTGTGLLTVTIATDFSTANWAPFVTVERSGTGATANYVAIRNATIAAGTVTLECQDNNTTPALVDPGTWFGFGLGDQ